jgi:hypothetical protein
MELMQQITDFNANFENIRISANNFTISKTHEVLGEIFTDQIPFSQVWADMSVNGLPGKRNLTGIVSLVLRNQGKDNGTAIHLYSFITIEAAESTKNADNFCKLVQYLFDWVGKYIDENNVLDRTGIKFKVPEFLYSSASFEKAFPTT